MDREVQDAWGDLEREARTQIRTGTTLVRGTRVFQYVRLATADDFESTELFAHASNGVKGDWKVVRRVWRQKVDSDQWRALYNRGTNPIGLEPTINQESADFPVSEGAALLQALQGILVQVSPPGLFIGPGGTLHELECVTGNCPVKFTWWESGPPEWAGLVAFASQLSLRCETYLTRK